MTDFILPEGYGQIVYPEELLAARVKELEAEVAALNEALDGMHRSNKAHRERGKEPEAALREMFEAVCGETGSAQARQRFRLPV